MPFGEASAPAHSKVGLILRELQASHITAHNHLASTLAIKEISVRTGFGHVPSFDRWFRGAFGDA